MIAIGFDRPLQVGDRFQLTAEAARKLRPRGGRKGLIVRDDGDEWRIVYDGTAQVRGLHKSFIRAEGDR